MQVFILDFMPLKSIYALLSQICISLAFCVDITTSLLSIAPTTSASSASKLGPWSMTCESRKLNFLSSSWADNLFALFDEMKPLPRLPQTWWCPQPPSQGGRRRTFHGWWAGLMAAPNSNTPLVTILFHDDHPSFKSQQHNCDNERVSWLKDLALGRRIDIEFIFSPVRVKKLIFHIVTISNWDQIKESSTNWAIHPEQSKNWKQKPEMNSENIQSIVINMQENVFIATNKKTWQTQTRKEGDGARLQCSPPTLLVSLQHQVFSLPFSLSLFSSFAMLPSYFACLSLALGFRRIKNHHNVS